MILNRPLTRCLTLCLIVALVLGLTACSSQDAGTAKPSQPAAEPAAAEAPDNTSSQPAGETADNSIDETTNDDAGEVSDEAGGDSEGIDLTSVDVCQLLPVAEIEAVTGPLGADPPKTTISIDREKGCEYRDADGHFYEVTFYPLDHWGLVKYTLNEATPEDGVGDGAYWGNYSDAVVLNVLAQDRAVIGVRASDDSKETALALYQIALKHLP